jgi:hypothetical protein
MVHPIWCGLMAEGRWRGRSKLLNNEALRVLGVGRRAIDRGKLNARGPAGGDNTMLLWAEEGKGVEAARNRKWRVEGRDPEWTEKAGV